jgi:hypothetical protein
MLSILYGVAAFAYLAFIYRDDPFCSRLGKRRLCVAIAVLAFGAAVWDTFASLGVRAVDSLLNPSGQRRRSSWISVAVTTLTVGVGLMSVPFWIYAGYGEFHFEDTWADVSCLFTEGYGYAFLFLVAPVLALGTCIKEIVLRQFLQKRTGLH